jgi:3,4-dihydroxy 2-butanone 4-phosphate synthase/GTP cyclohydrolase II
MGEDNENYLITKRERLGHDIPVRSDRHGGKETA